MDQVLMCFGAALLIASCSSAASTGGIGNGSSAKHSSGTRDDGSGGDLETGGMACGPHDSFSCNDGFTMCYAICAADLDAGLRDSLFAQQTYTRDCIEAIRLYGPLDAENSLKDFCLAHCFDDDDPYWDQNLFEEDGSIGEFIKEIEVPENIFYNVIYDFQEAPATSLRLNCPEGTIPVGAQVYMMNCVSCELFDKFPDQRNNY